MMIKNKSLGKTCSQQFYRNNHLAFIGAAFASVMMGIVNLLLSGLMKELFDTISGTEGCIPLNQLLLAAVGLMLLIVLIQCINYHSKPRFMKRAMLQYKNFIFEQLTRKNISAFQEEATASYISALSNDANSIEQNFLDNQFTLISQLITACGAFVMMLLYSPILTLAAVIVSILPVMASMLAGNHLETAERQVSKQNESFIATLTDSLTGFSVIKSFQAEHAITKLFQTSNASVEQAKCKRRKTACIISTIGAVAGAMAQFGVFIAGAYLALAGKGVSSGIVIAFVNLMNFVIQPIAEVPQILANQKAAKALIDKLATALEDNIRDHGRPISNTSTPKIHVRNLSFAYKESEPVLHNMDLQFEAGKSYAIVGASGSGKSTLLHLLMASHDDYTGSISLDETELRDISSQSLYDVISIIQQNVFVFNASIRDNITMFRDFPKAEVDQAIRLSGLSDLIAERGEDYLCGENGKGLSGGEKQRISIARSLLKHSRILLVDEATAALDAQTASQVSNAILDLEGLTRIVVTHALDAALLKRYDCILTLKNGRITETGSFDALMEQKGYFYSLFTVSQ